MLVGQQAGVYPADTPVVAVAGRGGGTLRLRTERARSAPSARSNGTATARPRADRGPEGRERAAAA
jgi:hypothetical protein